MMQLPFCHLPGDQKYRWYFRWLVWVHGVVVSQLVAEAIHVLRGREVGGWKRFRASSSQVVARRLCGEGTNMFLIS
jgi:hypothetical protein